MSRMQGFATRPDFRALALAPTGLVAPLAVLAEHATLGHMLVAFDIDGAPRYEYPALEYDVDYYPSMAVRVAQRYLGVPWDDVGVELGRAIVLERFTCPPIRDANAHRLSRTIAGVSDLRVFAGA